MSLGQSRQRSLRLGRFFATALPLAKRLAKVFHDHLKLTVVIRPG